MKNTPVPARRNTKNGMLSAKAWPSRNRAYSSSVAINSLLRFILSEMYPATGDINIPTRDIIPAMEEATVSSAPKSRAKLATRGKVICPAAPFARLIKISTKNFHVHRLVFASFTESPPASLFRRLFSRRCIQHTGFGIGLP